MTKKMTVNEKFETVKAFLIENGADDSMVDFIKERMELQAKKSGGSKKPTKTQVENEGIKSDILAVIDGQMTATQIMEALDGGYTIQKITSLLTAMAKAGAVVREKDKKSTLFSLPTATDEDEGE